MAKQTEKLRKEKREREQHQLLQVGTWNIVSPTTNGFHTWGIVQELKTTALVVGHVKPTM